MDAAAGSIATLGVGRQDVVINVSEYDVTRLKVHQNAALQLDGNGDAFDGTRRLDRPERQDQLGRPDLSGRRSAPRICRARPGSG